MTPPPPRKPGSNGATNLAYAGDRGEVELEAVGVGLTPPPPPPSVHPENTHDSVSPKENRQPGDERSVGILIGPNNGKNGDEVPPGGNFSLGKTLVDLRSKVRDVTVRNHQKVKVFCTLLAGLLYNVYLALAINFLVSNETGMDWCHGTGFLLLLTALVYWSLFYYWILKRYFGRRILTSIFKPIGTASKRILQNRLWRGLLTSAVGSGVGAFLVWDAWDQPRRLISAMGVLILIAVGFLISRHPTRVNWAQVAWAIGLQFSLGLAVLRWEFGRNVLNCLSSKVTTFLDFATTGSDFVYGYLSSGKPTDELNFPTIFAFKPLSVMFFFGFCISLAYHYGWMQWIITKLGWVLQTTVGTTAAESMNAAANIFLGMLESPLLIKPFLGKMTNSEIHTIMTSGFATVAGAAFAAYIAFGVSASYVISATVMASFCSLGYSKLIYPETEVSQTTLGDVSGIQTKTEGTALDAAAQGAIQGVIMVGCVIANIIAFVSFVNFLNAVIGWFGARIGLGYLSFEYLLGKVFVPVAWIMGVDPEECETVALLLGLKTVANEFIAYQRLVKTALSPRSRAIASFALCSFANVGSVGISLGGLSALVPERRTDFGKVILWAIVSGTIVGFLNGCIAGILLNEPGYAEWAASLVELNLTTSTITPGTVVVR